VLVDEIHPTRFGENRKQFTSSTGLSFFDVLTIGNGTC